MPRGKIQMNLIGDAQDRVKVFKRRKVGLVKKAKELTKLCDVDIALVVCAGPDGAPAVWESDPSVVIDSQLGKEERRLDKKWRQGLNPLACPGEAILKDMNLEELLASIDAELLTTAERQKTLGVADDNAQQLGQQAWVDELMWDGAEPLPLNNASMMQPASGVIQYINGGNDVDMVSNHQCLQAPTS
ncbi:unnamed protein product [Miscanthus lutarioriparius]|uniref:MADS-box domain-containing protein n=1 Tax=Miscanthus lutarioriparius TaxID=422564 RepID=A0A811RS40_9POAL|nr:unnamed protein product [Miscanthus lutarioriparius]